MVDKIDLSLEKMKTKKNVGERGMFVKIGIFWQKSPIQTLGVCQMLWVAI